jgi:aromatic ring-opening dioxygenase catalytic subunit (LigB family)
MKMPTLFLSHGGGPWPVMQTGTTYQVMHAALQAIPAALPVSPTAILTVSAHWEESTFSVATTAKPGMFYDYYGFPEHTYSIQYAAPGAPELALRTVELCQAAGVNVTAVAQRDFDHGVFVPLMVMYPQANIPVLQMSLRRDLDPAAHIALGQALAPLREQGVLIIGSGFSYHNMRGYGPQGKETSAQFDDWLGHTVMGCTGVARAATLGAWQSAPSARACHPREEHLLPLMVAAGAAYDDPAKRCYFEADFMGGVTASSFWFG